ncbi:ABC-type amino acid transport substrate-binding protein [Pseudarthrobacter sp. W1I19]|nr:ABC-type amino acid transport substrate-binding protein [Pseudarthrobacter sp. W1I19]
MRTRSQKFRRGLAMAMAAVAASLATACGGSPASTPSADNPYALIQPDTVRVASVGDLKPYAFADAQGNYTGFDVELFKDVAKRAGVDNVVFTGQDFSAILPAVANGQFDVGVAAIGITDKRKETVDFSNGYLAGYLTVLTTKDSGIKDVEGLSGKRLGVVQGTLQEAYAVKNFPTASLDRFPDNNSAIAAVNSGSADAHFLTTRPPRTTPSSTAWSVLPTSPPSTHPQVSPSPRTRQPSKKH